MPITRIILELPVEMGDELARIAEAFEIADLNDSLKPGQELTVRATSADGKVKEFKVVTRINTPVELQYYRNGGILHTVLRNFLKQ